MPDFERMIDKLHVDSAKTPEDLARTLGFIEGKKVARQQIAIASAVIAAITVAASIFLPFAS